MKITSNYYTAIPKTSGNINSTKKINLNQAPSFKSLRKPKITYVETFTKKIVNFVKGAFGKQKNLYYENGAPKLVVNGKIKTCFFPDGKIRYHETPDSKFEYLYTKDGSVKSVKWVKKNKLFSFNNEDAIPPDINW